MLTQEQFDNFVNQLKDDNLHYLLIKQDNQVFRHAFNDKTTPSDVRSIAKTVLALFCGMVIDKHHDFNIDTLVWPFLEPIVNLRNQDNLFYLKQLKIKHLLNHTIGFDQVLLMRNDIKELNPYSLVDLVVNTPITYHPGSHYLYSNAGFYLLAIVLERYLKQDLLTVIQHQLFDPLDIKDFHWQHYGHYLAGATKLFLMPEDLLKIGEVLLNNDQSLVSSDWIQFLKKITVLTPKNDTPTHQYFRRYGYGSGMWVNHQDLYFGHGTDGQTLVMIPDKKAIIITMAQQRNVKHLESVIDQIISALYQ